MAGIRVKSVRRVVSERPVPVYDITNNTDHNFALANGAVVHNSAKYARDPDYQEVLKLKGKPINAARATLAQTLASEPVQNILTAIGFDPKNPDKALRVGKVMILADADPDGEHITLLILTLLWKLCRRLFDDGRVYVVDAPLYMASYRGKKFFGDTLEDVKRKFPDNAKAHITRIKGWGESLSSNTMLNTSCGVRSIGNVRSGSVEVPGGNATPICSHEYGYRKNIRISTANGYSLSGHKKHKVLTLSKKGNLKWKPLGKVRVNDHVAISYGQNIWSTNVPIFEDSPVANGPKKLTLELARLLGYWAGDNLAKLDAMRCLVSCFPDIIPRIEETKGQHSTVIQTKRIHDFLAYLGATGGAENKEIPSCILNAPKEYVVEFLRGLFEASGRLSYTTLEYNIASPVLHDQVALLLLNVGIVITSTGYCVHANRLVIEKANIDVFLREIGVASYSKQRGVDNLVFPINEMDIIPNDGDDPRVLHPGLMDTIDYTLRNKVFWSRVISNKSVGKDKHYDLTLPEGDSDFQGRCYVANGFIVHNCNSEDLTPIAFDPATRKLIKIMPVSGKEEIELNNVVGEDTTTRKQILGVKDHVQ